MLNIILAEHLKIKHTFCRKLPFISPIVPVLMALILTGGLDAALPISAWNWWYILIMPGSLAVICYLIIKKDKKIKYFNMLSVNSSIEKSLLGKIVYCSLILILSNFIIYFCNFIGGNIFGTTISPLSGLYGAIILSITCFWEIPLFIYLSARFGMFICIFVTLIMSIGGVAFLADSSYWWICPFSISIRLMTPVLGILPNGLPVPDGSRLSNSSVILPGIIIAITWFIILTYLTVCWFKRLEDK